MSAVAKSDRPMTTKDRQKWLKWRYAETYEWLRKNQSSSSWDFVHVPIEALERLLLNSR